MSSFGDFVWPCSGPVECPDWDPTPACGHGLHGLLDGEGYGTLLDWEPDTVWLVAEVDEWVNLGGKVKAPRAVVVHAGDRASATAWLVERCPGRAVVGATVVAGDHGMAVAGYGGTATAGDRGTATAGDRGTAIAGYRGTATAGDDGTATAGDRGTATAGDRGTATAGYRGTATAGYRGTATAGDCGTAIAGYCGTATAGDDGTATVRHGGTAAAGVGGTIQVQWWDGARYRVAIGYVGEDGIEPNVAYHVVDGRLTKKESTIR
jgi:hypothetical protein